MVTPLLWFGFAVFAYLGFCLIARRYFRLALYRPWKFLVDPRLAAVDGVELVDVYPHAGERLYAWHLPPQNPDAPVLIYFDGNRGNLSIWNRRWRRIAAAGAGFIALSYRGYGGSTRQPSEAGFHEDARHVWAWAEQRYPRNQLALHGYSLGSGVASKLATDLRDVPLILEGAYCSIPAVAWELVPLFPMGFIFRDSYRTKDWIGDVTSPILIVHGSRDRIVSIAQAQKLYRLARGPKRFERIAGANHVTLPVNGLYPLIWDFLSYRPDNTLTDRYFSDDDR